MPCTHKTVGRRGAGGGGGRVRRQDDQRRSNRRNHSPRPASPPEAMRTSGNPELRQEYHSQMAEVARWDARHPEQQQPNYDNRGTRYHDDRRRSRSTSPAAQHHYRSRSPLQPRQEFGDQVAVPVHTAPPATGVPSAGAGFAGSPYPDAVAGANFGGAGFGGYVFGGPGFSAAGGYPALPWVCVRFCVRPSYLLRSYPTRCRFALHASTHQYLRSSSSSSSSSSLRSCSCSCPCYLCC